MEVTKAMESGTKPVIELATAKGRKLKATEEHLILTDCGWVMAKDLLLGQKLVAEASLNLIDLDTYLNRLESGQWEGLKFLDPKHYVVHHKDFNPLNNSLDNLQILPLKDHMVLHATKGGDWKNVAYGTELDTLVSKCDLPPEPVFDLSVEGSEPNFLANGIVVHNCGKTRLIESTIDGLLSQGVQPRSIMYMLFNRRPADQFRGRYFAKGFTDDDLAWWNTHHAICRRLLKLPRHKILDLEKWGDEHGFELAGDDMDGWDSVMGSLSAKIYSARRDFDEEETRLLDALKKTEAEEGKYCHVRYMEKALNMDLFPQGVEYVFVDEAQDNGLLQTRWLERVAAREEVKGMLLVGDDKQCINLFKGADPELFLGFPADRTVDMESTYRLPKEILAETNGIVGPVTRRSGLTENSLNVGRGEVLELGDFREATGDIRDALKAGRSVHVLARNRIWLDAVRRHLTRSGIPTENDWNANVKRTLAGLILVRQSGLLTETSLGMLLPSYPLRKRGELLLKSFWQADAVRKLREGKIEEDPSLHEAYEQARFGGGLPLGQASRMGFLPSFAEAIAAWEVPDENWNLDGDDLYCFKESVRDFGWNYPLVRVSTIHAAKGEEADLVVLLRNITGATERGEREDEDSERRVWYVGASRAMRTLILTSLSGHPRRTAII
jgi:hypothetical protein